MSTTINPAMQSVAMSYMPSQESAAQKESLKMSDRSEPTTTSGGNTTVSLSGQGLAAAANDYADLAASQTINNAAQVQERSVETNETTNITYPANLQAQANYNAQQLSETGSAKSAEPQA